MLYLGGKAGVENLKKYCWISDRNIAFVVIPVPTNQRTLGAFLD